VRDESAKCNKAFQRQQHLSHKKQMTLNQQTIEHHYGINTPQPHEGAQIALDNKVFYQPGEGIVVCVDNFTPVQSMEVPFFKRRIPCLEFVYFLSADASFSIDNQQGTKTAIKSGTRTVIYDSEISGICEASASVAVQALYVYITPEKILSLTGETNHHIVTKFLSQVFKENGYSRPTEIQPAIEIIVHQIFHCNFCEAANKTFIEGKTLELLAYEIENIYGRIRYKESFHPDDIRQLQLAKTIMMENMAAPPTIDRLARKVGLNQKKVKKGFRELYNTTVFGFLRQYRMEQARLIFERDLVNVSEVACTVGYTNASHFTAAFRNHFGINPGAYLKMQRNSHTSRTNPM
jgi:AraC family transcriptional regulator, transcriptional activator of the genes for pyochelin and ferripyochelin receptors